MRKIQRFTGSRRKVKTITMDNATEEEHTSLPLGDVDDSCKNSAKIDKTLKNKLQKKKGELSKKNMSPTTGMLERRDDSVEEATITKELHVPIFPGRRKNRKGEKKDSTVRSAEASAESKELHRRNFVAATCPDGIITMYQPKSKHHTAEKVDMCLRILRHKKDPTLDLLESDESNYYNVVNKYFLVESADGEGNNETILMRTVKDIKTGKVTSFRVIPNEAIFDCIYDVHIKMGH